MTVKGKSRVESEERLCKKEGVVTEFRKYRRGYDSKGNPRFQWRCMSCQSKSDMRAKTRLRDKIDKIKRGESDVSVFAAVPESRVDMIQSAWEYWVEVTKRPDLKVPNERFVEACNHVIEAAGYTKDQLIDDIDAASYLPPASRDPLDVKRVCMVITWSHEEARAMKARSRDNAQRHLFSSYGNLAAHGS